MYHTSDYRDIILSKLEENRAVRGYRKQLADACRCSTSFFSQVVLGKVQMTPDQAMGLSAFWGLGLESAEYFIDLVHLARAGTKKYRGHLERRIAHRRKCELQISKRRSAQTIGTENQLVYYSHWSFVAVHTILVIPGFQSSDSISRRLGLSVFEVQKVLRALQDMGLAHHDSGKWTSSMKNIHLPARSPLAWVNHNNWRQFAMSQTPFQEYALHYSSVLAMGREGPSEAATTNPRFD